VFHLLMTKNIPALAEQCVYRVTTVAAASITRRLFIQMSRLKSTWLISKEPKSKCLQA